MLRHRIVLGLAVACLAVAAALPLTSPATADEDPAKAEEKIAKTVPHTAMVNTDDLAKLEDRVHFDAKATMTLGDRFAEAYLKMRPARD